MTNHDDALRQALADLRDSALPRLQPPGAQQARITLRRRRATRSAVVAAVFVLLAVIAWVRPGPTAPPPTNPQPSTSTTAGATPTSSPPITASVGAAATTVSTGCSKLYIYDNGTDGSKGVFHSKVFPFGGTPCPGDRIKLTYVSYKLNPDWTQTVYATRVYYLTPDKPNITFNEVRPASCYGQSVTLEGNVAVKQTLPVDFMKTMYAYYPTDDKNRNRPVAYSQLDVDCLNSMPSPRPTDSPTP